MPLTIEILDSDLVHIRRSKSSYRDVWIVHQAIFTRKHEIWLILWCQHLLMLGKLVFTFRLLNEGMGDLAQSLTLALPRPFVYHGREGVLQALYLTQ